MPNDKSAVDEFLAGLNKPAEDPFKSADPFAPKIEEEVEEKKEEGVEGDVVEEDVLPFHKDPKVQRYVEKQISKALKNVQSSVTRETTDNSEDEVTSVLERIIGNDTPEKIQGVKDLRKVLGGLEDKAATRALQQFEEQAQAQIEEDRKAEEELEESFDEIESTFKVDLSSNNPQARKMRSDFVDYVRKIAPKNDEGEVASFPDLPAAFEEFQERGKRSAPSASRAKGLASRSIGRSTDATVTPPQTEKNWKSIDKLFSNLTN